MESFSCIPILYGSNNEIILMPDVLMLITPITLPPCDTLPLLPQHHNLVCFACAAELHVVFVVVLSTLTREWR